MDANLCDWQRTASIDPAQSAVPIDKSLLSKGAFELQFALGKLNLALSQNGSHCWFAVICLSYSRDFHGRDLYTSRC